MINKRLLIKNLLAHNDEISFYDKKRKVDISLKEGKAKFLKHICALSNSNPQLMRLHLLEKTYGNIMVVLSSLEMAA